MAVAQWMECVAMKGAALRASTAVMQVLEVGAAQKDMIAVESIVAYLG
jgi:hypothetical protein